MTTFNDLKFRIDENNDTFATHTLQNGIEAKVVRENNNQYRIYIYRDGKPLSQTDRLQRIARKINFTHGEIGVTCVLVGLGIEAEIEMEQNSHYTKNDGNNNENR